ncbi:extracellular solute-binding protein [Spiractinospora alimapuensis]|uniref:extracellular solute-binding protein n=1 Tax=Spiractinospora alimapuensis TaxID=2820884 RepID=UPI001F3B43DC|nr:extracellular solute-binding protein [Spiractinospora alimapuensis]QVQ53635.1 extracellular solute-binding protein [Spiractinospora alimapuensis]
MRPLKVGATATAALLLLSACGSDDNGGEQSGEAPDTLEVWRMGDSTDEYLEYHDDIAAEFQEQYPDTEIDVVWIPWDDFENRFTTAMVDGGPDLVEIGNDQVARWAEAGALYDITDMAEEWELRDAVLEDAFANGTVDGVQYSLPWFSGVRALWYRSDWLDELDADPPENWDELVDVAEAIDDEYGANGFAAPTDFVNGIASFIWSAGGEIAVQEGEEWSGRLSSPETTEALEFYASLTVDGISPSACAGANEVDCAHADFVNGDLGMFIDGPWARAQLAELSDGSTDDSWATAPIPGRDGIAPAFAGGSDLAVWATTEYPHAAFDYLTLLNNEDNSLAYAQLADFFPPYEELLDSAEFQDDPIQGGAATQAMGELRALPETPNWGHVQWELATLQNAALRLAEGEDSDTVLAEADEELDEALNRPVD